MDERELRDRLTSVAEDVVPSVDLAARAEHRYRRRRNRARAVGGVVVVALLASAIATAAIISHKTTSSTVLSPTPITLGRASTPIDARDIIAVSFIDANVGFGLRTSRGGVLAGEVVSTDDGGRSWHHAGYLQGQLSLHMTDGQSGVAYGEGPLEITTDGGKNWSAPPGGPMHANQLSWSGDWMWSFIACDVSSPCDTLQVSDDGGRSWRTTAALRKVLNSPAVLAVAPSTAFVAGGDGAGTSQLATTSNGGRSWQYRPTPCGNLDAHLESNGPTLLLICAGGRTATQEFDAYTSGNEGRAWQSAGRDPFVGGYFGALTHVGSRFVAAMQRGEIWSSADGRAWRQDTNVGEGFWSLAVVPGVGAWSVGGSGDRAHARISFSTDGVRWVSRAVSSPTTATPTSRPVDPKEIWTMSFIDADRGFGLIHAPGVSMQSIVTTADGGRTWHVVSTLQTANTFVHFEDASNGALWGEGALQSTTDGGRHWRVPTGAPAHGELAWSGGRLWAASCVVFAPCDATAVMISDDAGSTWSTTAVRGRPDTIIAPSRSSAYVLELDSASIPGPFSLARTSDGGVSWESRPTPCRFSGARLASNGDQLVLVCRNEAVKGPIGVYTSDDRGDTWTPASAGPLGGFVESLTNYGSTFVAGKKYSGIWTSSDGRSWRQSASESHVRWYFDSVPGVGVWATNSDGPGSRIWFSRDGVHWEQRTGG